MSLKDKIDTYHIQNLQQSLEIQNFDYYNVTVKKFNVSENKKYILCLCKISRIIEIVNKY